MPNQVDEPIKNADSNQDNEPFTPLPITDDPYDDFICFHMRDGSSVASSGGVTVIGRKVPKTITSLNGQELELELELPIPLSPSLRITRVSMTYDELCVNNPWYKRVWAYLNKPFTSK